MNPHVKEHVRDSSDDAREINRSVGVPNFVWKKSEKLVDFVDGFLESRLDCINE